MSKEIQQKIDFLNVKKEDIIKYKKSQYRKNIFKILILIYALMTLFLYESCQAESFVYYNIALIISILIGYLILWNAILKITTDDSLIENAIYSHTYIKRFCKNKEIINKNVYMTDINNIKDRKRFDIMTNSRLKEVHFANKLENSLLYKSIIPSTIITFLILLIICYNVGGFLDESSLLEMCNVKNLIIAGMMFMISIIVACIPFEISFNIQSKLLWKKIDILNHYYQIGYLNETNLQKIEKGTGLIIVDLDSKNYNEILEYYNVAKIDIVKTYRDTYISNKIKFTIGAYVITTSIFYALLKNNLLNISTQTSISAFIIMLISIYVVTSKIRLKNRIYDKGSVFSIIIKKLQKKQESELSTNDIELYYKKLCSNPIHFTYCLNKCYFPKENNLF